MSVSLKRVGQGREAEIFEWEASHVVRLMRDPGASERIERERAALGAAWAGGAPVPEVGDLLTLDGRPGLVMERIDGGDLIERVARRPWAIFDAASLLGRIHVAVHRVAAPPELRGSRVLLEERITTASLPSRLASAALRVLEHLPDGDRLCHGDFHPGNVLVSPRGPLVVDWTNASRGTPDADVARTLLMLELAVVPDTMPAIVRRMSSVGRRLFLRGYVRAYGRLRTWDDDAIRHWKLVHAAARVAEGIVEEEPLLIRYVEQHASDA